MTPFGHPNKSSFAIDTLFWVYFKVTMEENTIGRYIEMTDCRPVMPPPSHASVFLKSDVFACESLVPLILFPGG